MVRFRRPTKTVEAIQFTGDWKAVADALGCHTQKELEALWPKVDRDFDGTMYSPPRYDRPLLPMPINVGDWIILGNGRIESFATSDWFDEWEHLDD